jgi:hypothetical protein
MRGEKRPQTFSRPKREQTRAGDVVSDRPTMRFADE